MLEIGSVVDGKYKILSEIGRGGMSVVYMAINEKANKPWAVKEVRKDGTKDFEVVKQGLIVETDMLKKLSHFNLPSIVDVIEEKETLVIVMDYIEGNPLSKSLEAFGALQQEFVVEWAKQLCNVLGYLHTRKPAIIYRDMKPSNIMLKPDGNLVLIDFGIAREYKETKIQDTTHLGTVGYAAPEQFGGQGQTDARTDIYSLGATLYHLVTGCSPCEPPYEIRPIRQINPSLSGGLEKIILKCTQRNPDDRYRSCAELKYDLEHFEDMDDRQRKRQKRKLGVFAASAALTVLLAGTSMWGFFTAEAKKGENYEMILAQADDVSLGQEFRQTKYLQAIEIDPARTEAYLRMTDMLTAEGLTNDEQTVFTQLQVGLNVKNTDGFSVTINPLPQLRSSNPTGYAEVYNKIGEAYWYYYDVGVRLDRSTLAASWFREAVEEYPSALIYCDIADCQEQIKSFADQNRFEKMNESYELLWQKLAEMNAFSTELDEGEKDTKLLIWQELVAMLSDQSGEFLEIKGEQELQDFLSEIEELAGALVEGTKSSATKESIETLRENIQKARDRIGAGGDAVR